MLNSQELNNLNKNFEANEIRQKWADDLFDELEKGVKNLTPEDVRQFCNVQIKLFKETVEENIESYFSNEHKWKKVEVQKSLLTLNTTKTKACLKGLWYDIQYDSNGRHFVFVDKSYVFLDTLEILKARNL